MIKDMNATVGLQEEVSEVNERTQWLAERRKGIGGSDVAPILGISPWRTPLDVWKDKTGKNPLESEETSAMYWGTVLEDVVAREFAYRTNKKVARRNSMFRDKQNPILIANIDRYILNEKAILECKTSNAFAAKEWGEDSSDKIPLFYLTQIMHYMMVTGYKESYLAVLIGGNDYRIYHQEYDEVLAKMIRAKCEEFWEKYVKTDTPPPASNLADVAELYKNSNGEAIVATPEVMKACEQLKAIKGNIKSLEADKDKCELIIKDFIGNNEILIDERGGKLATWKSSTTNRLDSKKLKAEIPEVHEKFVKASESRRFLLK